MISLYNFALLVDIIPRWKHIAFFWIFIAAIIQSFEPKTLLHSVHSGSLISTEFRFTNCLRTYKELFTSKLKIPKTRLMHLYNWLQGDTVEKLEI